MKGIRVPEHYALTLSTREGLALRRVIQDALADSEFPLNELEEETLEDLVNVLDPENELAR